MADEAVRGSSRTDGEEDRAGDTEAGPGRPTGENTGPWDERTSAVGSPSEWLDWLAAGTESVDEGSDDGDSGGNVAGDLTPAGPVEPGEPELENALFVLLGVYLASLALARLLLGGAGYTLERFAAVTGVVLVLGAVGLAYFGLLTPDT